MRQEMGWEQEMGEGETFSCIELHLFLFSHLSFFRIFLKFFFNSCSTLFHVVLNISVFMLLIIILGITLKDSTITE